MRGKKGISPVIATVLLIAMVIVIGLIVFLWFRGWQGDVITKFGEDIELSCSDVNFDASYDSFSDTMNIVNGGLVPIYGMEVKASGGGSSDTKDLGGDFEGWPASGLNQGEIASVRMNFVSGVTEVELIPILAGDSDEGEKSFVCDESYGKELII